MKRFLRIMIFLGVTAAVVAGIVGLMFFIDKAFILLTIPFGPVVGFLFFWAGPWENDEGCEVIFERG